jgi:8-oxo-dGTP pyrophosphatase MutT (NUDIX family)
MKTYRNAARTIILDEKNGKIAILEVKNGDYHKIPGGGIEADESAEETALREAWEEAGCEVRLVKKLGEIEFVDPDDADKIHHSICFLAQKIKDKETAFTDEEMENKFRLLWLSFYEAIKLFEKIKSHDRMDMEMNNRDLKFIKIAKEYLSDKKYR